MTAGSTGETPEQSALAARPAPDRPATIYDVARHAGVSHQTVSRYLRGDGIRPATRERVENALSALDYRMNLTARSLRMRQSFRIAAFTHDITQVGPSKTAQGATVAAREAGYVLDLVSFDLLDRSAIDRAVSLIAAQEVAGVLALSATDTMIEAFAHTRFAAPVLIVEEEDDPSDDDPAGIHVRAMRLSIDHLTALGHRSFHYVSGPSGWRSARNRLAAFRREMARIGVADAAVSEGTWSPESGYDAVMALADPGAATALVVANDQMALGAMLGLEERGLRVPDDVSVIGFDDIPEARFFRPPLTTIRQDFAQMGRAAVGSIIGEITGTNPFSPAAPTVELVVRRSTAPARA